MNRYKIRLPKVLVKSLVIVPMVLVMVSTSCTDGFDELNVDPFNPTETSDEFLFNGVLSRVVWPQDFWLYGHNHRMYQWSQLAASSGGGPGSGGDDTPNNINNLGRDAVWNQFYNMARTFRALEQRLMSDFDPDRQSNKLHVAKIVWAYYALQVTDLYGGMPFSEAGKGTQEVIRPVYDTQESIYTAALTMLKEAVDNIIVDYDNTNTSAGNAILDYGNGDTIFDNDMEKWIRFANTVRLRHALRMSNVNATLAQTHGSEAMTRGVMRDMDDQFVFSPLDPNGISFGGVWWSFEFYGGIRLGENAWKYMNANDNPAVDGSDIIDPRTYIWYEANEDDEWVAMPQSWGTDSRVQDVAGHPYQTQRQNDDDDPTGAFKDHYSAFNWYLVNNRGNQPQFHISYSEACFMKAEAIHKGWGSGSAQTEYENGIRASIEKWYMHGTTHPDWTAVPTTPTTAEVDAFIANPRIAYAGDNATGLQQIHTQRWLDYMLQADQAWHLARRSGVIPMLEVKNRIANAVEPTVRRLGYPASETDQNGTNLAEQLQRIGGSDDITARNWWDVN